jgi:glycogen debranching enzyme
MTRHLSPQEEHEREDRVLTQGEPSIVHSITDAVVVKDGDLFFLTTPDGIVPLEDGHGYGLYYHDCRFLNGYELDLGGIRPDTMVSTATRGFMAVFQLTNPDLRMDDGTLIPKEHIGIKWERVIDSARLVLDDVILCQNFEPSPVSFPLALTFRAAFEDVFAVRELLPEPRGRLHPPTWHDGTLRFVYEGADGLYRSLTIHFSPAPESADGTTAHFHLALQPRERKQLLVSFVVAESSDPKELYAPAQYRPDLKKVKALVQRSYDDWLANETEVRSTSLLLNQVLDRSVRDLRLLRSSLAGQEFFAAGVPWFVALFGRDSLITALQTLAYNPDIAEHTLRLLAGYQGQRVDAWRDEQPGKILHELRVGELARLGEVPHTPYYGTIDATPLFLILIGHHAAWTGDLTVFNELRGHVELALEWMARYGDPNGDGYLAYQRLSEKGLANQGWKDSGDAIVNSDGSLATPPIALVEVQGYAYLAKLTVADLYRRAGEPGRADQLQQEAEQLRSRFNRDFWLTDKGFYALALQAGKRPVAVLSSNPGHALWAGVADPEKAQRTVERLMAEDMFTGWGVRTLSDTEMRYNPFGYHLGTVWPHDNSILAAGFRRYGFDDAALRVLTGLLEAAMHFAHYRLPELFAGFGRAEYEVPVRYPVACRPQAWAAGTVPYLLASSLGLVPEAFDRRLRIVRPVLPPFVSQLEVRRLRVGRARVDLRFERASDGSITVSVLRCDGPLHVVVELQASTP